VVTHQLQVEHSTGKVRRPKTDVLPLCHTTNQYRDTKQRCFSASMSEGRLMCGLPYTWEYTAAKSYMSKCKGNQ